jgi:hypothetical protein
MKSVMCSKTFALFAMLLYMLCGFSLFLLSQNHCFAYASIFSDPHDDFSAHDVISNGEEASNDEKFKSTVTGFTLSQYLHPDIKEKNCQPFIFIILKQIDRSHFSLRSPPIFSS